MKLMIPPDHPFAVDIPTLDLEGVQPGTEIDCDQLDTDEVLSFLAQGWVPVDKAAKTLDKALDDGAIDAPEPKVESGDAAGITSDTAADSEVTE